MTLSVLLRSVKGACFFLFLLALLLGSKRSAAQTVDSITLAPSGSYCRGSAVTVYYKLGGLLSITVTGATAEVINSSNVVVYTVSPAPATPSGNGVHSFNATFPIALTGNNLRMRVTISALLILPFSNTSAQFTISPATVGGAVSANQAVCSGNIPAAGLTLSGHTGSVVKWQRSTSSNFSANVTDIANTTTTLPAATIGALTATTYFRAVVQSGTCEAVNSAAATITVNSVTFPVPAVTPVSCNGGANGTIVSTATGAGTISYSINPSAGTQSPAGTFSNLPANTYTITASDAGTGCTNARTVTVSQPAILSFSPAKTDVTSCITANGSITVTASGGTAAYQYSKDNGVTYQTSNIFSSLAAGTYAIRVKDAGNCITAATNVTILAQSNFPALSGLSHVNVTCTGGNNGSITFGATGGTAPYSFSINNGSSYFSGAAPYTFANLIAGSYQALVRDANGCQSAASGVTVGTTNPRPDGTLGGSTICEGQPGTLTFTATAGTAPFVLQINGITYTNIQSGVPFNVNVPPVVNSNYILTLITDANGCNNP